MPVKTTKSEEEYFFQQETERLAKLAEERKAKLAAEERAKAKELHWMHCPKCGDGLEAMHHGEIEIDRCFGCGGIWLDDGELEKIVEHETATDEGGTFMRSLMSIFKGGK